MILDCVLTATNNIPQYIEFVPIFIKTWKKLYPNVDIKIIIVADEIPEFIKEYNKFLILFKPIKKINTGFITQYIRMLYPCILNYKNGVLITDMDMLPMNKTYYTKNIAPYSNDKFIYFRKGAAGNKQIAMCYNVATPQIWKDIFKINSVEDIIQRFNTTKREFGWCTDQAHLQVYVMKWNKITNNLIQLKDSSTGFKRLNRGKNLTLENKKKLINISQGKYSDYHCLRPYSKYKIMNDTIYNLL